MKGTVPSRENDSLGENHILKLRGLLDVLLSNHNIVW